MKKIYSLLLLVISSVSFAQTFYSENMGATVASNTIFTSYTGWQNTTPIIYSGTGSARTTTASSGYSGASGGVNAFIGATTGVGQYFQIEGLNTSAYQAQNIQLSFGYTKGTAASDAMLLEKSTDGTNWSPITFTDNTTTAWSLITISGGQIPSTATLYLRFTNTTTATTNAPNFRVDDVKLSNVSASCTLVLGTPTTLCDASTLGTDTYTVTIPYTGGGNATYTITPASGTVGGDNPTSLAAGNIVITGVAEGTNFSATVTGGTCNFSATANSPECKPINTLPYSESFPYTAGAALGSQQKWTSTNSGDDILVASGSLSHAGVTSTGNSIAFTGAGKECATPFTATTTGTIYAAFLFSVTDLANMTGTGTETYFAGLTGTSNSDYKARIFSKKVGTQYQIGFDTAATTTNYDATLRNLGDVVYIVIGYDFGTNALNCWINPTNGAAPSLSAVPTATFVNLGGFTIRQDSDLLTPSISFDELRIVTSLTDLGLTLGVKENNITGLKMYPNPANHGTLFIETAANATKAVTIYDVLGKQVLNTTTADNAINVSALTAGVYVVKITEEGKTATKKLVIE